MNDFKSSLKTVFDRKTSRIFTIILFICLLFWITIILWPNSNYLDSPFGLFAVFPVISVYIFHGIGVPGLLENDGACGWGWCSPTIFGWIFLIIFWLLVTWLSSKFLASLTQTPD